MRNSKLPSSVAEQLVAEAFLAREQAYTPYSNYSVGAALLDADGHTYTGCNIENASYTPTVYAERTAFFSAVKLGIRSFRAIAVVGGPAGVDPTGYAAPCGVCRQVMAEFCTPDFEILLAQDPGRPDHFATYTLEELLPLSFTSKDLT